METNKTTREVREQLILNFNTERASNDEIVSMAEIMLELGELIEAEERAA